jgi:hypothetical protein
MRNSKKQRQKPRGVLQLSSNEHCMVFQNVRFSIFTFFTIFLILNFIFLFVENFNLKKLKFENIRIKKF